MFRDEKKGFIETLLVAFSKNTVDGRKKIQTKTYNNIDNEMVKISDKNGNIKMVNAYDIKKGTIVIVEIGDIIPCDGEVIEGLALVDESAITGESVPVIKEAVGDSSLVVSGTRVVNNWLKIKVIKTPNELYGDKIVSSKELNVI